MKAAARTESRNPALGAEQAREAQRVERATRIPMSIPRLKLHIPEGACPGFHLHWFLDGPGRVAQALQGGYEFVNRDEVDVPNTSYANDHADSGNTDLGTRVSLYGGADDKGNTLRLYLMKIRDEWFQEDQDSVQEQVDRGEQTIRQGRVGTDRSGENSADIAARRLESSFQTNKITRAPARRVAI